MSKFNIDELCRLRSDLKTGMVVGSTLRYQSQIDRYIKTLDNVINSEPAVEHSLLPLSGVADKAYMRGYEVGKAEGILKANAARPQGEWINREAVSNTTFPFWERYECNKCHKYNGYSNFCPNCGADMRSKGGAE